MGAEIAVLWEKLRIPEKQQRAFTQSVQGLGLDTMEKGENELQRLHAMKSAMLGKLIVEARETIANLWEQTNANSESTRSFSPYHVQDEDLFDDDLLEKHEAYIEELQERLEQMRPIIRLIERREVVVRERIEYEELQKDPERLQQRGAAMTKQLMAEEKMAKRIKRDLPKLTELLLEKLAEWKQLHNEDFRFDGQLYLEKMDQQEAQWKQYKAEEMQRKLKKKQEEKSIVDQGRFGGVSKSRSVLADSTKQHNVVATTDTAAILKPVKPRTHQSAGIHQHQLPGVRPTLGEKNASTRF
jgi:Ase1/PRC1/MAP65 family protein